MQGPLLGRSASQVATYAVIWPAHHVSKANVVAVAARDGGRAREYAKQHGCVLFARAK